ncbi:MAG TPA: putative peptidoglycan glycosyltransferase FtsW [Planctomycetota bacterium]|nr:putative peptidoglycan glycosyltransferase FtsW [Planctomycetota bacterium]
MAGALTVKEAESVGAVAPAEARPRALEVVLAAVAALCGLGLVMAVSVQGPERGVLLAIKAQGGKLAVATIGFLAFALVPLRLLRRFATPAFLVCVALCLIAALFGREVNNARRWLPWGGQPVEFARFALIVFCAAAVQRAGPEIVTFRRGMLPLLGAGTLLAGVLALQPDMGNAFLALLTSAAIALVAGVRLRWFAVLGVPALVAFAFAALQLDYVRNRLAGFFAGTPSFQVQQSLHALGSGGLFGKGIGAGTMKLGHVPEAGNDFVFAIVGEELGLLGCALTLAAYAAIAVCGLRLLGRAADPFARYLVFGFTFAICFQAAMNLCVVTGVIPPKGIDLPFVSSGGTNLLFCMSAIGVLGNAARTRAAPSPVGRRG